MHSSYLCEIYIHIISVLFVCSQELTHQNHHNSYNRRIIRPNSEHNLKQQLSQQDAMFAGRAHPRPNTIGFEDTTQRPPESRLPSSESTAHARQQMPYQSNDPHLRPTNSRQQLISHLSHGRQDSHEMPFHLPPKYVKNSKSFHSRRSIHPEIIEDPRHLRIQSPMEREEEFDDELQNVQQNSNFRQSQKRPRNNFGYNDNRNNDANHDSQQSFQSFNQRRDPFHSDKQNFFPDQDQDQSGLKTVKPNVDSRLQGTRGGFEVFSTKHEQQEFDKIFPEQHKHNPQPFNEMPSSEESEDYGNVPENEAEIQRNLNLYPSVNAQEEIRRFNAPFVNPGTQQRRPNRQQMPGYLQNQFRDSDPNGFYSAQNQQNQNKDNHQNIEGFKQSIQHSPPFDSMSGVPNGQPFFGDNNPNGFDFRRNNINKQKNPFQQFYGNDIQRQTTQKPHQIHNTYERPVKKEIQIVREITEILPSDEEQSNEHYDLPPIATPSPPDPPRNDYFPFDDNIEKIEEKAHKKPKEKSIDLGKEESFYDDDEERQLLEQKNKDMDNDEEEDKIEKKSKSKFEKEIDSSADDLENYFDKEFANENEKEEEAQKKIEFDDEPKESNQLVSKKQKSEEAEDADVEAEYKTATDFLKNHDDFLNKIEKENEKFRKRTDDKVEKEEEEETETEKPKVDELEKELDAETEKKDGEEETEDKSKSDQNANKEDKGATEEEEANDSNEETKDKPKETEAEDDEESESKEVTEKEDQKSTDNNENNQQNDEKNEEQEEDNGVKDEEKGDNAESDETNDSNDEKETKSDKCLESNCDKELLKEESKESKNTQELKSRQEREGTEPVVQQKTSEESSVSQKSSSIETKPIEGKPNKSLRISQTHNFAPFFIDLKRINPNKSNTRKGLENNESLTSWTTSATTSPASSSSPKQRNTSIDSVSPHTESKDANKTMDNNNTIETRRVVNSIKDIIKSQHHR